MYETKLDTSSLAWSLLDFAGVSTKTLRTDMKTGGMTVMTQMAPGATIPIHSHNHSHETVYVVEGDFIEDGINYRPGCFLAGSAGTIHGPHSTSEGCILLTTFSATLDFVLTK